MWSRWNVVGENSVGGICVDDFNGTSRFQLHLQLSDKRKTVSKYLDGMEIRRRSKNPATRDLQETIGEIFRLGPERFFLVTDIRD